MVILLTYDIDKMWSEVKQAALAAGFRDFAVTNAMQKFELPFTTLLVEATSPRDAMDRFIQVVRGVSTSIVIGRAASFDWASGATHADKGGLDLIVEALTRP